VLQTSQSINNSAAATQAWAFSTWRAYVKHLAGRKGVWQQIALRQDDILKRECFRGWHKVRCHILLLAASLKLQVS
jgi:hypothetical protein